MATPATSIQGTPPGTTIPLEYAKALGRYLYVWGWPMANTHARAAAMHQVPEPGLKGGILPVAPINRLAMLTDYIDPAQRFVAAPNQDVVYGLSALALDRSPVVVQVPDFGDRFWVFQLADQRTDAFGELGKMYGSQPGFYLLVGPAWKGTPPPGMNGVFRSPTNTAFVFPRAFVDDTHADKDAIQATLNGIDVFPLDEFDGKPNQHDWRMLPTFSGGASGSGEARWVDPETFFELLPALLDEVPPLPGEEAIYAQARTLAEAAKGDSSLMQALQALAAETERDLMKGVLFQWRNQGIRQPHGWTMQVNAAEWGTDYLTRASAARANIFSNRPNETLYLALDLGPDGSRLNGNTSYTLTFSGGAVPVRGFWSLTMYNEAHFFEPNEIHRYSLGSKNKDLVFAADGSLTVYVSHDRPKDPRHASNWLPAPSGDFSLYIRAYWPEPSIMEGTWVPPAVLIA